MKIYLDDKNWGRKLKPTTGVVYGIIARYSYSGKGWFGSYKALSDISPVILSKSTVSNAIDELLKCNLIIKKEDAYFVQNLDKNVQNLDSNVQNLDNSVQNLDENSFPPNNPLLLNNIKERENIAREDNFDAPLSLQEDFFLVTLAAFGLQAGARNVTPKQEQNAKAAWQRYSPEQQQALLDAVRKGYNVKGNFQFTVEDFLRNQAADPEPCAAPTNYNGCDPPKEPTAVAFYNGEWGLYTLADIQKFNLTTKNSKQ